MVPARAFRTAFEADLVLPDGASVRLSGESADLGAELAALLGDALVPAGEAGAPVATLRAWHEDRGSPITVDGEPNDTGHGALDTAARLARIAATVAAAGRGWLAGLHAAAVRRGGATVLLPAVGGSGKTTLSAWLVARGWTLFNDDLAVLREPDLALVPAPFPLSIKSGSVAVLDARYPALRDRPVRADRAGREVRDLWLERSRLADRPGIVTHAVLPHRTPDAGRASIEPVGPDEVLRALLAGGVQLSGGASPEGVGRLVAWLGALDCRRLSYADADEAADLLESLDVPAPAGG